MQNIKPMKMKLARRYQIYGVLVAAKSQRPIDILYCIDGSGYSDWKIANGFLIDGSRIFHQITNDDRQRDDGPNNRSRSCSSRLAGIISHMMKPSGVCTWPISRLCYIGGGIYIYIYHVYRGAGQWKSLLLSANEARSGSYRHGRFC